jgi:molybdopterin-guanine dinucleotide biosynthesis protein A
MGRNKALLPYRGTALVEYVAHVVREAAGSAALIGDLDRLGHLGLAIYPDELTGLGPISGIYTALRVTATDWNLVVACDMPAVGVPTLRRLLERAETSGHNCVAASGPSGKPEPLCAVYHRRCLPVLSGAIRDRRLKMRELVAEMGLMLVGVDGSALANVNTPAEWAEFQTKPSLQTKL